MLNKIKEEKINSKREKAMGVKYKTITEYGKYSTDLNKFSNFNSYVTNEYIHTLGLYIFECVRHITHNIFFYRGLLYLWGSV